MNQLIHMTVTLWSRDLVMMSHVTGTGSGPLYTWSGDFCIDRDFSAQESETENMISRTLF